MAFFRVQQNIKKRSGEIGRLIGGEIIERALQLKE